MSDRNDASRRELEQRAVRLERELYAVRDELRGLGSEVLPGEFLEAEAAGVRFLVPLPAIREVVWLVELEPSGGAPPWVAGSFSYRGEVYGAIDLARRLGHVREPALDAKMLVLAATRPVAAIVDRVVGLVREPRLHRPGADEPLAPAPFSGVCERGTELLPLLDPEALGREEAAAG